MVRGGGLLRLLPLLPFLFLIQRAPSRQLQASAPGLCFEQISVRQGVHMEEHPTRGRLVVAQQSGLILVLSRPGVQSYREASLLGTFLDLRSRVHFVGEAGLLGFAFHPGFLSNGRFFVSFICNPALQPDCRAVCECRAATGCRPARAPPCDLTTMIEEYRVVGRPKTSLRLKKIKTILKIGRPFPNHFGGQIWFGADGFLYIASGDGGSASELQSSADPFRLSQNGRTLVGKILRIDVNVPFVPGGSPNRTYLIPASNPFARSSSVRREIYALGFRNPYGCFLDRPTGTLLCGDEGQSIAEEINIIRSGANYGWSYYEGTSPFRPNPPKHPLGGKFTFPAQQYFHQGATPAGVVGGPVYRSSRNRCLSGKYLYNDLYGAIYVADVLSSPPGAPKQVPTYSCPAAKYPAGCGLRWPPTGFNILFIWATDFAGEAYILSLAGIHRVIAGSVCGYSC